MKIDQHIEVMPNCEQAASNLGRHTSTEDHKRSDPE